VNRKQRRAANKIAKKHGTENLSKKISQFGSLPDECSACTTPYDKTNKQMATTWNVVVREEQGIVRLYCPACWELANNAIETMREEIENVCNENTNQGD
tara:strand:+ start:103 stop:399 length:297 start_codon:yes stop_codon:yes gene_type:complete